MRDQRAKKKKIQQKKKKKKKTKKGKEKEKKKGAKEGFDFERNMIPLLILFIY